MRRKLTFATLLTLSAAGSQALALGVGDVEVRSSLNAPLRAILPLTDTRGLEPERLNVSLADRQAFESAGLSWSPLAASVNMAVRQDQGQWVVELTSERAVREPWLDLMLRFDWPSGRQLREVTLLLDPPNYAQLPALIEGSGTSGAEAVAQRAGGAAEPDRPGEASRSVSSPQASSRGAAWIDSGDTLWSVAARLRPDDDIGIHQMMVALLEANPEAFAHGNINAMRAGLTLEVPPREAIVQRSAAEASRVVQRMNQAWASRGNAAPSPVSLEGDGGSEQPAVASVDSVAEQPVDTADSAQGAAGEGDEPRGDRDGGPHLTLLTDAQAAAEKSREAQGLDPTVLASLGGEQWVLDSDGRRLARLERRWQESRQALEAVQAERNALQSDLSRLRDEMAAMRDTMAKLQASRSASEAAGAGSLKVPAATDVEPGAGGAEQTPWWGAVYQMRGDSHLLLGAAGIAALLGVWLLIRWRRRSVVEEPSEFVTMPAVAVAPTAEEPGAEPPPLAPEPAVMPQAEAISEADIFMAYGRYDQARELLEAGVEREPARHDLRLKLLNVCIEQGDRATAERQVELLHEHADPALAEEAARLLARHESHSHSPASASELTERRVSEQAEMADTPAMGSDELAWSEAAEERADATRPEAQEAYESAPAAGRLASAPSEEWPSLFELDDRAVSASAAQASPDTEATLTPSESERVGEEGGPGVIDYQPPQLDPEPAARQETPMQPSVEFTPGVSSTRRDASPEADGWRPLGEHDAAALVLETGKEPGERLPEVDTSPLGEEWEVEEVAFPPLDVDNGQPLNADASRETLHEARRLLEADDAERARELLQRLLDEAEDPELRGDARDLISYHQL